ncbi:MAG: cob(I)yrinic acid a,c-diamide adenosyltransferase [Clostridia bacterium]|jgi:cob(I)alamin adenosyltransferase
MKGLVHIYTGDGKGKTTAALGLGMRAYGRGLKVLLIQFLKGAFTGEIETIKKLEPGFMIHRGEEIKKFTCDMNEKELEEAKRVQLRILNFAKDEILKGNRDVIILDEIMAAISMGMVDLKDVEELIKSKPERLEILMTGRDAPKELIELSDYVSEINAIKHPMDKGTKGRIGIES